MESYIAVNLHLFEIFDVANIHLFEIFCKSFGKKYDFYHHFSVSALVNHCFCYLNVKDRLVYFCVFPSVDSLPFFVSSPTPQGHQKLHHFVQPPHAARHKENHRVVPRYQNPRKVDGFCSFSFEPSPDVGGRMGWG